MRMMDKNTGEFSKKHAIMYIGVFNYWVFHWRGSSVIENEVFIKRLLFFRVFGVWTGLVASTCQHLLKYSSNFFIKMSSKQDIKFRKKNYFGQKRPWLTLCVTLYVRFAVIEHYGVSNIMSLSLLVILKLEWKQIKFLLNTIDVS